MADTNTPNIGMLLPDLSDTFNFGLHVENNFSLTDSMLGAVQCTSSTRPSNTYAGQIAYEADSKRYVQNTGTKASPVWVYTSHTLLPVTSSTHPTSGLTSGLGIYETDTGLSAVYNGSSFAYPSGQLLAKQATVGVVASITFSSIPQVFTNLKLTMAARSNGTTVAGYDSASLRVNGVSTSNYNWNSWFATQGVSGVTTVGAVSVSGIQCSEVWNSHFATAARGIAVIDIPNYTDVTTQKVITSQSAATDGGAAGIQQTYSGALAVGTSAVTSITVLMNTGSFIADSVFTLTGS